MLPFRRDLEQLQQLYEDFPVYSILRRRLVGVVISNPLSVKRRKEAREDVEKPWSYEG